MTETDDSEYEETETVSKESISGTGDEGCRTDEESPSPEQTIESGTAGDNVYTATLRDDKDTYRHNELTGLTGCGAYSSTNGHWEIVDRPVTEWDMARSGIKTDFPCQGHSELVNRPVMESVSVREGKDTKFPSNEHLDKESDIVDRPVTETVMARSRSETDFSRDEHSYIVNRPVTEPVTTRHGSDTDFLSGKHSDFADRPVTRSVSIRSGRNTDYDSKEHSRVLDRPVTESVMERPTDTLETLSVHMPTVVAETLDLGVVGLCITDKRSMPVCREKCISDSQRPSMTSPVAFQQIDTRNDNFPGTDV